MTVAGTHRRRKRRYVHDTTAKIQGRIDRFVRERIVPAVEHRRLPLTIQMWEVPDEPVPFSEAVRQPFSDVAPGTPWSKPWGTAWFHVTGTVPDGWADPSVALEVLVDLGFSRRQPGFQAEGLVYRPDGTIVKAIEPLNNYVPISAPDGSPATDGTVIDLFVEAAANPDVGGHHEYLPTPLGDKATSGSDPIYTLRRIELVQRHLETYELLADCRTLVGLAAELEPALPRRAEILRALERMCDVVDPDDIAGTAAAGREQLARVLAAPAYASAHRVVAVGHAHIDSAWLWPTRETVRKCARTFSNVLALMDEDPDFVFACSSAQQYDWVKRHYPELFERIRTRVTEGRFLPVGGMWVESDTNMPGGEALVRQFVAGKGFFLREFGVEPTVVWLPDSFGYTAAFPQIARLAGCDYFLTQKISWNDTNRMPHHTFWWEGIDGTRILTHFPPTDTYNSTLLPADLARAQRQYAEKGLSNLSLVPFGFGDGGGGPTREMLAAASRARDLEGSPRVSLGTPLAFFEQAHQDHPDPQVWSGEMYLELHRGTYTSQARTKHGNRRCEHLLREVELWSATAAIRGLADYPYAELQQCWELVLLQQFHDILPGSSIAWVHQEAEANYERVADTLHRLLDRAQHALAGEGSLAVTFNAAPVAASGVTAMAAAIVPESFAVRPEPRGDGWSGWELDNGLVRARLDAAGQLVSFVELSSGRELLAAGQSAALLQVFRDTPNEWDAWDIDRHYQRTVTDLRDPERVAVEQDAVVVVHAYGRSRLTQRFRMPNDRPELEVETHADWHEHEKLLKMAFPLAVHADRAASEIQFGHVQRPTHTNTSWDVARFETPAHRWVHVAETGFGVVVANDSTYGHDVTRRWADDGSTVTLVRESLLRGPRFPDPEADQGQHLTRTVLAPAATVLQAMDVGYRLNLPTRTVRGARAVEPLVTVSVPTVVVEAVKLAEDRSGDLVVRLYEGSGGRARARISFSAPMRRIWVTDLLEREQPSGHGSAIVGEGDGTGVEVELRPFQILTLRAQPV